MQPVSSIARSALNAAQTSLAVTAHNLANQQTPGFRQSRTLYAEAGVTGQPGRAVGGGVRVADIGPTRGSANAMADDARPSNTDIVGNLLELENAETLFRLNLEVLETADAMLDELLHLRPTR